MCAHVRLRCRGATGRGRSKNAILGQSMAYICCRSGPKLRGRGVVGSRQLKIGAPSVRCAPVLVVSGCPAWFVSSGGIIVQTQVVLTVNPRICNW